MKRLGIVVLLLGIGVLILGVVVAVQLGGVIAQIRAAQSTSGWEGLAQAFDALGSFFNWVGNSFSLLIVNLFLTGAALVFSGLTFTRATAQSKGVSSLPKTE
jgi:ABC-type maltose transport system permease subunit